MNWFNLKDLENRLINNNVSDKEGFNYLLASLILSTLGSYAATDGFYNNEVFLFIEIVLGLLILIVGLKFTFNANQNGDGNNYLKRYISLYFVVGIRFTVFVILLAIPVGILTYFIFESVVSSKYIQDFIYIGLFTTAGIIFYYLLVRSFKRVAGSNR